MTVGTKSVLFGAHAFWLHPWFVAAAWWKLYGFPWDPRLWVAFFIHDLGYIGKPNMDGKEGEQHPILGARIMRALFDGGRGESDHTLAMGQWGRFSLLHSRYFAKSLRMNPSRLCVADKLALALTPWWLYLPMVRATGEIAEYMAHARHRVEGNEAVNADERERLLSGQQREWYAGVQAYMRRWVAQHQHDQRDTWTSDARKRATLDDNGVWK